MSILDFLVNNYINILLIVSFLIAIFLSKFYNTKKSYISFIFLLTSFIFTIFHYIYKNSEDQLSLIGISIFMELAMALYALYAVTTSKKLHIIFTMPLIISIPFLIIFKANILISFVACAVYLLLLLICSILLIIKSKDTIRGIILIICSVVSMTSLVIDYISKDYSLLNVTLILCLIVLFVRFYVSEYNKSKVEQEKLVQNQKTSIAISQIQPHFLYNSLATIGYLCKEDPKMASNAIDKFSDYLRANLNSLSKMENVPFVDELKHIKTYLWLEKLRFEERLEIEYDIQIKEFLIPSLSIQPLVENAVKHGICNKKEGGKITLRTIEYEKCIKVVIEDNGVGFDINSEKKNDGKTHVGIDNVKSRIASMANGTLEIQSTVGKGTISTITLPKEEK